MQLPFVLETDFFTHSNAGKAESDLLPREPISNFFLQSFAGEATRGLVKEFFHMLSEVGAAVK
jgi:hypothetical protein